MRNPGASHPKEVRELLFTQDELLALDELRGTSPLRIVSEGVLSFWFEFEDRYLEARFREFEPLSQNQHDEALALRPEWHEGPSNATGNILASNQEIEDILIVRTLLWFTDHVLFATEEEALAGVPPPRNRTERLLREMLAKATGGHENVVTHPSRIDEVRAPVANLMDVGWITVVGGQRLACFIQTNSAIRESDFVDDLGDDFSACYATLSLDDALRA